MAYVHAEEGELPAGSDKPNRDYYDEHGNKRVRVGGSRSWRNNNPGNLKNYRFSKENGSIGHDEQNFAIFPDEQTGQQARRKLLKGSKYRHLTLEQMARKYEPEEGRCEAYCRCIAKRSVLERIRVLGSLSDDEFDRMLAAMQCCEGWTSGEEHYFPLRRIIGVRRGKKRSFEHFQIETRGWLVKEDAICVAETENLCVIVVHMKNGGKYLRSKLREPRFSELLC